MQFLKRNSSKGLTLIELSIGITIIGIFTAFGLNAYNKAVEQKRVRITQENMKKVVRALSTYAESNSRIPCPSDPASPENPIGDSPVLGWEVGIKYSETLTTAASKPINDTGTCSNAGNVPGLVRDVFEGVVPFVTLGISYDDSLDGWGRPFTYAVSPILTNDNDQSGSPVDTGTVHVTVRTGSWVVNNDNVNGPKARFCGLNNLTVATPVLNIVSRDGGGTDIPLVPAFTPPSAPTYLNLHVRHERITIGGPLEDAVAPADRGGNLIPAFVLISHGKNGEGSYLLDNTPNKYGVMAPGTLETENYDVPADMTYREQDINLSLGAASFFDDYVMWLTQEGLLAYNGKSSCSRP